MPGQPDIHPHLSGGSATGWRRARRRGSAVAVWGSIRYSGQILTELRDLRAALAQFQRALVPDSLINPFRGLRLRRGILRSCLNRRMLTTHSGPEDEDSLQRFSRGAFTKADVGREVYLHSHALRVPSMSTPNRTRREQGRQDSMLTQQEAEAEFYRLASPRRRGRYRDLVKTPLRGR